MDQVSNWSPMMTNNFITKQISRTDTNQLILYVIYFIACSSVTTLVYAWNGFNTPYYVCLSITILIIILCTSLYTVRVGNIKQHPIFKSLVKYGEYNSIQYQINTEVSSSSTIRKEKLLFTNNWILHPYFRGLYIIQRQELIWVYAKDLATRHSINFIPTGTTHTYSIVMNYTEPIPSSGMLCARTLEIKAKDNSGSREVLEYIIQYAPWILAGYTKEIADLWENNTSRVIDFVKNRYKSST